MSEKFELISLKPGFMKHNGGVLFRNISENEYEFKSTINENHLNAAGITHGGYLAALIDAGAGTAAHRSCLLYTSPSPRDATLSRMPSSA